jgi:hypothetical protein
MEKEIVLIRRELGNYWIWIQDERLRYRVHDYMNRKYYRMKDNERHGFINSHKDLLHCPNSCPIGKIVELIDKNFPNAFIFRSMFMPKYHTKEYLIEPVPSVYNEHGIIDIWANNGWSILSDYDNTTYIHIDMRDRNEREGSSTDTI